MKRIVLATSALAFALTACGGGGSSTALPPSSHDPSAQLARVNVTIVIPPKATSSQAKPKYVSPSTQSISVAVDSGTPAVANLTAGSSNCNTPAPLSPLTCTVPIAAPAGTHSFTLVTYDGTSGSGNVLSQNTVASQNITANQVNTVNVTLGGVPKSLSLATLAAPTNAFIQGGLAGLQLTDGSSFPLVIVPLDADGNAIVGPGAPTVAVTSTGTNASNFAIAAATNGNPNQYTITSATAGQRAVMSITATPTMGATLTTTVPLTSGAYVSTVMNATTFVPSYQPTSLIVGANGLLNYSYNNPTTGRGGIYSVDPATPAVPPVALDSGYSNGPMSTPDSQVTYVSGLAYNATNQHLYYVQGNNFFLGGVCDIGYITGTSASTIIAGSGCVSDANGTGTSAAFNTPSGMTIDANGTLFVAESNGCTIRQVSAAGAAITVAGQSARCGVAVDSATGTSALLDHPYSIAYDSGNHKLYVGDFCQIRSVDPASTFAVATVAGGYTCATLDGTGSSAYFQKVNSLTYDPDDQKLYIVDPCAIRSVTTDVVPGVVSTIAGSSGFCTGGVDGFAAAASLKPKYVVYNPADHDLYFIDATQSGAAFTLRKVIL